MGSGRGHQPGPTAMMTRLRCQHLTRWCGLALGASLGSGSEGAAGAEREAAAQVVLELGSQDFAVRQRASGALEQAGSEVIELLAAASMSDDVEVRSRAMKILLTHSLGPAGAAREQ